MKKVFDETVTVSHTAVLGKTGSGKTSTAKLLIEQVVREGARVCILDPIKSDWWGITSSSDGKHAGLPFDILGGPHGHIPITANSGKIVGELVGKGQLRHSIIDMADFGAGGSGLFFNEFAPALLKNTRGVLYLVLEEAHEFAPKERSGMTGENMNVYYAKKMATAGRSKGLRLVLVSQRVQSLHNALLGSCETLIAHKFTAPADKEPVLKWLGGNVDKEVTATVAKNIGTLATGEGYIVNGSGFELKQFPPITTFDNSATPTSDDEVHVVTAPVDKTALRQMVGLAVAEAEMNDPGLLKAEIARLKQVLNGKTFDTTHSAADADRLRHEGWVQGYEKGKQGGYGEGHRFAMEQIGEWERNNDVRMMQLLANILEDTQNVRELMKPPTAADVALFCPPQPIVTKEERAALLEPVKKRRVTDGGDMNSFGAAVPKPEGGYAIRGGKRKMLTALAQYPQGLSAKRMSLLIDMSANSGTWRNYVADLRKLGWIAGGSEQFVITPLGLKELGDWDPLPTGAALINYWSQRLGGKKREMFDVVVREPNGISADGLAKRVDMAVNSGTWRNYMAELRGLGLMVGTKHNLQVAQELYQ